MAHTASGTALTERPQSGASAALATVVYRSRAVAPLPDQDLQHCQWSLNPGSPALGVLSLRR